MSDSHAVDALLIVTGTFVRVQSVSLHSHPDSLNKTMIFFHAREHETLLFQCQVMLQVRA